MLLEQYYLSCLSQASYLVGDAKAGVAAVVDPRRDVEAYLAEARRHGVAIRHVVLTHFHADFVSGHLELAAKTGATIHLGAAAKADYAFQAMRDGDEIRLGSVRLVWMETPGHTPESSSILVYEGGAKAPHAVFTGDTLFVGDVGRPDLLSSAGLTAEDLAGQMWESLHGKLLRLPDETIVYPGHGAGSACGKNMSRETSSTIGAQRRVNCALQHETRAAFVEDLTHGQPEAPRYFASAAAQNRGLHPTLEESLTRALTPLDLDAFLAKSEDHEVLDARDPHTFAAAHLAGSVNVGLGGRFAEWAGTVLDPERPLVLVADPGREAEAAVRLGRVGVDRVAGFLEGGTGAMRAAPERLRTVPRHSPASLARALGGTDPPHVLDVRTPGEREMDALPGSQHVPLNALLDALDEVPRDREVAVVCAGGYRSMIGASLLARAGHARVSDLASGMYGWLTARR
jgi:glyoxylase-like metal-dependent hydrolase (beta-lactamase superfamily II)